MKYNWQQFQQPRQNWMPQTKTMVSWYKRIGDAPLPATKHLLLTYQIYWYNGTWRCTSPSCRSYTATSSLSWRGQRRWSCGDSRLIYVFRIINRSRFVVVVLASVVWYLGTCYPGTWYRTWLTATCCMSMLVYMYQTVHTYLPVVVCCTFAICPSHDNVW